MKRMKKKDWLNALQFCCPVCRSTDVHATGMFDAHQYENYCNNCDQVFLEIMETTGYKLVPNDGISELAIKTKDDFHFMKETNGSQ